MAFPGVRFQPSPADKKQSRKLGKTGSKYKNLQPQVTAVRGVGSSPQAIHDLERQKTIIQAIFQTDTPNRDLRNVALELYTSEVSYVVSLHRIVLYALPEAKTFFRKDAAEVEKLFGNIEELRDLHVTFLDSLIERYKKWTEQACVGDVLAAGFENFRSVYAKYCAHYENASQLLAAHAKKKAMIQFCEKVQSACEQPLPALLIMPVQRLPRYRMLLEDLIKKIDKAYGASHPDYGGLQAALHLIGTIADEINTALREAASQRTAEHVMKTVKGSEFFTSSPSRRIIADAENIRITVLQAEGAIKMGQSQITSYERAILLTDAIVFCSAPTGSKDPKFTISETVDIHLLWVDDNVPSGYDVSTSLRFLTPEQDYVVTCGSRLERESWRSTVTNGIQSWVDSHKLHGSPMDNGEPYRKFNYSFSAESALLPQCSYQGEWAHAKPAGHGVITFPSGEVYEGQVTGGRRSGIGKMTWPTGSVYEGQWQKDLPHGTGSITAVGPNKQTLYQYSGGFYLGRRNGTGTSRWTPSAAMPEITYEGDIKNDRFDGQGVLIVVGFSRYEGEFQAGVYQGKGVLDHLGSGDRLAGTFVNGSLHGPGSYTNERLGIKYEGDFAQGRYHGEGQLSHGSFVYRGSFREGLFHGQGEAVYADHSRYTGQWENGYCHGKGKFTQSNPEQLEYDGNFSRGSWEGQGSLTTPRYQYSGSFEHNCFHGAGELRVANFFSYIGAFRYGQRHGEGVATMEGAGSYQYTGSWSYDVPHGKGRWKADHSTYDGDWVNGSPHGQGKLIIPEHTTYSGSWNMGLRSGAATFTLEASVLAGEWVSDRPHGEMAASSVLDINAKKTEVYKDGIMQTQFASAVVPVFNADHCARVIPFFVTPFPPLASLLN